MKKGALIAGLIVIAGLGFFVFSQNQDTSQDVVMEDTSVETGETEDSMQEESSEPGVVNISMDMDNYSYTPNVINTKPGDTVNVTLVNVKGEHDFIIEELDVHTDHVDNPGDILEVTFTIPEDQEPGSYEFYCAVANHRQLGMVGELIIE